MCGTCVARTAADGVSERTRWTLTTSRPAATGHETVEVPQVVQPDMWRLGGGAGGPAPPVDVVIIGPSPTVNSQSSGLALQVGGYVLDEDLDQLVSR